MRQKWLYNVEWFQGQPFGYVIYRQFALDTADPAVAIVQVLRVPPERDPHGPEGSLTVKSFQGPTGKVWVD